MEPIVNGIRKRYSDCMKLEHVNFRASTAWHELLSPIGAPEFALLDSSKQVLHRWFGVVSLDEFSAVLDPLCLG
jgi:hypothetical protein